MQPTKTAGSTLLLLCFTLVTATACRPSAPLAEGEWRDDEPAEEAAREAEPAKPAPEPEREPQAVPPTPTPTPTEPTAPPALPADSPLLHPEQATAKAPERFSVVLETTKGDVYLDVRRSWAPLGADRFYNLVEIGYFTDVAFFRVVEGFMAQVGLHGDPAVNRAWRTARIDDDPVTQSNTRGMVSFATSGKNSRVNQFFINFGDNSRLDPMGFAPFGRVRNMDVVDKLYSGYGEGAPMGRGPAQALIQSRGNEYLRGDFPALDYIRRAFFIDKKDAPLKQKSNLERPR